ncbi:MAG TPA: hypothetical protein VF649_02045 [Sphingomonas sp.]|jgi:hypothetical protein|uniref:hypothetical protein n=1 Tax=Sphingomonas sp. TaxID=28214 RepID=UPI002ED8C81F
MTIVSRFDIRAVPTFRMPGYAGLEIWQWNTHSLSETAAAIAASVIVAIAVTD